MAPEIELRPCAGAVEHPKLLEVWRSAVLATHHFLTRADFEFYESAVCREALGQVRLVVALVGGEVVGFSGTGGRNLEMLFVHDDHRGTGIGGALLDEAVRRIPELTLDVNEQNPQALVFYENRGFVVIGRSETDADGRPYPLLHMALLAG